MKAIELLKINERPFKIAQMAGLRLNDYRYLDLYSEYSDLKAHGEKVTYIVSFLSDKYSVSERKIYEVIKRFGKRCTFHAV